jgi:transcriptional regulator with XRE-family HTH domain
MQLGEKISLARKKKGLTQEELAGLTGLTVRTIQRIESNATSPQSFSLKKIASALDLEFESLIAVPLPTPANEQPMPVKDLPYPDNTTYHFMTVLNFSCFFYLVIPWVHFLVPIRLLKKRTDLPAADVEMGQKIIRQQIYWIIALHISMLLLLAYNLITVSINGDKGNTINYLWPFFLLYALNAVIILRNDFMIRRRHNTLIAKINKGYVG